jgi:UPF0716 protein FxsA
LLGALLLVAVEIAAFAAVAGHIGVLLALLVLVVVSASGPLVVRRVGVGLLAHTRARLERGEVPSRDIVAGVVVLGAGVLICIPGFVSDALGLLLMVSPVRHLLIRASGHRLARRVQHSRAATWRVMDARVRPGSEDPPPDRLPRPRDE